MKFVKISDNKEIIEIITHYNPFEEPAKSALPPEWVFMRVDDRCEMSWVYSAEREAFIPPSINWFQMQERNASDEWFKQELNALTARDDVAFHMWEAAILYREEFIELMRQRKVKYDELNAKYQGVNFSEVLDAIAPVKPTTVVFLGTQS
jgi:hypothetical protein